MPDANEATTGMRDAIDAPAPDDAEMTDAVTEIPEGGRRAGVDPKLSPKLSTRFVQRDAFASPIHPPKHHPLTGEELQCPTSLGLVGCLLQLLRLVFLIHLHLLLQLQWRRLHLRHHEAARDEARTLSATVRCLLHGVRLRRLDEARRLLVLARRRDLQRLERYAEMWEAHDLDLKIWRACSAHADA